MSSERLIYARNDLAQVTIDDHGVKISEQSLWAVDHEVPSSNSLFCCGGQPIPIKTFHDHIPFRNIIYVDPGANDDEVTLTYVYPTSKDSIKLATLEVQVQNYNNNKLSEYILDKAYTNHIIRPSVLVLVNPHGGQGKAVSIYENEIYPILKAARAKVTLEETKYQTHATDIAKELDISKYDIIACCSGDGIPHEVINGFFAREDKGAEAFNKIAVTQLPCGSGNALSLSTHGSNNAGMATFQMLKAKRTKLDLMAVTQGSGPAKKTKLSFLTQCYGIIADSDIGTEHLRWMGPVRFQIGIAQKVFSGAKYPCELYVNFLTKDKREIINHVETHMQLSSSQRDEELPVVTADNLAVTGPDLDQPVPDNWAHISAEITDNLNILYVGKMPYISDSAQFFPAALPNDGSMDMVMTDSKASFMETTSIMLSVEEGTHVHNDKVKHAKVLGYRLIPKVNDRTKHYISVDGEEFPFEALQVEVLPGVLTGLLQDGSYVETCFTR
ncbi:sphingosine kinase [Spathaspora passalidarum NRRL Y-27907]|uniref:Sphingosine kinase n=1 Tax=Spathaspora passalidarum (strain NRRL Y-27907 / 11-Y1) TaxID=619300 RepID=G3APW1_SPAPN|nr:sphingosine kinase [Spathaspora passalidarum NRRL Y-27907]EGW32282.1 sphingosine kinase [Spathaspora passalidarum NRRL Y-27907]